MTEVPGRLRHQGRKAPFAARIASGLVAAPLLLWAYVILDNIWNYNDSGTFSYVVFAAIPGVPGLLAAVLAVRGRLKP